MAGLASLTDLFPRLADQPGTPGWKNTVMGRDPYDYIRTANGKPLAIKRAFHQRTGRDYPYASARQMDKQRRQRAEGHH